MLNFNDNLHQLPPNAIIHMPLSNLLRALLRVHINQLPAGLNLRLNKVSHMTTIVSKAILSPIRYIEVLTRRNRSITRRHSIITFAIHASRMNLPRATLNRSNPRTHKIIIHISPITRIFAVTMRLQFRPFRSIHGLTQSRLLRVLMQAVIVQTIEGHNTGTRHTVPNTRRRIQTNLHKTMETKQVVQDFFHRLYQVVRNRITMCFIHTRIIMTRVMLTDHLRRTRYTLRIHLWRQLQIDSQIIIIKLNHVVRSDVVTQRGLIRWFNVTSITVRRFRTVTRGTLGIFRITYVNRHVRRNSVRVKVVTMRMIRRIQASRTATANSGSILQKR